MTITKEPIELKQEKNLVIGCIVSDKFLKDLYQVMKDTSLLVSPELRLVTGWCLDYFSKYGVAPKETIGDIFEIEKVNLKSAQIIFIENLLTHLSETYLDTEFNADFFFTNAKRYLDERNLLIISEKIRGYTIKGETEKAYSIIKGVKKVETAIGSGVDILNDIEAINDMFDNPDVDTFEIPGALGKAIQDKYRGDVMCVAGRQKLGKTYFLNELAKWAALSGEKVSYVTFEMKTSLMLKRFYSNLVGAKTTYNDEPIIVPYFKERGDHKFDLSFVYDRVSTIDKHSCLKQQKAFKVHCRGGGIRLFDPSDLPDSKDMMEAIDYKLDNLRDYESYNTSVLVLDYDAIIPAPFKDERDRLDYIWQYAKKIASKNNILVILASQNNKQTFTRDAEAEDVSGDSRKIGHVSHLITLNQTPEEKKAHILRIKVLGRHGNFNPLDEVVCLQNIDVGKAVIDSKFKHEIANYKEFVEAMNTDNF